jgi:glycosidase
MSRMLPAVLALVLALVVTPTVAAANLIERVEPASWWIGMKDDRLQLLVHGTGVGTLEPAVRHPGVTITGVERVANPNYLFVNLRIEPTTRPGRFDIAFRRGDRTVARHEYVLDARTVGSAERRGFGPADTIYLVVPDRYANGDPKNDSVAGMPDRLDRANPMGRHGGDLDGLIERVDYVADMGFTQLWLTPVLENDQDRASYHGYAITDFYRVDARFGSNEQYRQLAQRARQRGVGLVMDTVLNHCGSNHWWMRDLPAPDWINHGGQFAPTSHVHETWQDIHGTEEDRRAFADGWFVATMPDMNQRNPQLATYLIQNSLWWVEYLGLSGIRVDTYPYSDRAFLTEWSRRLTQEYPNLNIVGEEWNGDPAVVAYWQRGGSTHDGYVSYLPSLFDFPLQDAVAKGLLEAESGGTGLRRIYRVLAADKVYADPYNLVVFHDNHDMTRTLSALGERADLNRMALALTLTTRGVAQVFYGTEVLMSSPGEKNDGLIRSDFPGGWDGDARNAFTGAGLTAAERDMQDYVRKLLQWRKSAPAIREGKLTQYVPVDGVYVYFRHGAGQTVMVVLNNNDTPRTVDTKRFHEVIGTAATGTDVLTRQTVTLADGIVAPARSATILDVR